jgi:hypothetical protein
MTIQMIDEYQVAETATGVRCGNHGRGPAIRHADVAHVRACYQASADQEAQMRAEIAAENAMERWLENRGYEDARAQEAYDASWSFPY